MLPIITQDTIDLAPGTYLKFPATIAEYEQLVERMGDRAAIRMRFRNNQIQLMAPLPEHGNQTNVLADLIKSILRFQARDWHGFGVITLRRSGVPGVEPDACFYIQNYREILGKRQLDLEVDPPPDLAIEVDLTSITDIHDYIPFAVPEVWIYQRQHLRIYRFEQGQYAEQQTSQIFPAIAVQTLIPQFVERAWAIGSSAALREFEEVLRQTKG
jgi:Uma2 family endonuclease